LRNTHDEKIYICFFSQSLTIIKFIINSTDLLTDLGNKFLKVVMVNGLTLYIFLNKIEGICIAHNIGNIFLTTVTFERSIGINKYIWGKLWWILLLIRWWDKIPIKNNFLIAEKIQDYHNSAWTWNIISVTMNFCDL
jgi:hypothetical protein